jgi:phosphate acetyltransferase
MCLPGKVLVYGDCAINSDPTSEELAAIAVASADTAAAFGITPRVAMLSYATGDSNQGMLTIIWWLKSIIMDDDYLFNPKASI